MIYIEVTFFNNKNNYIEEDFSKLRNLLTNQKYMKPDIFDLESILKDTSKYDELIDNKRQPLNLIFLGHVDSGKSTICGNILILMDQVNENDIYRAKQALNKNYTGTGFLAHLFVVIYQEKAFRMNEVQKMRFNLNSKRVNTLLYPGD